MRKPNDLSRSLSVLNRNSTLIAVIEMSQSSWLIAGIVPGVERQPLKKLAVDESDNARLRGSTAVAALQRTGKISTAMPSRS